MHQFNPFYGTFMLKYEHVLGFCVQLPLGFIQYHMLQTRHEKIEV